MPPTNAAIQLTGRLSDLKLDKNRMNTNCPLPTVVHKGVCRALNGELARNSMLALLGTTGMGQTTAVHAWSQAHPNLPRPVRASTSGSLMDLLFCIGQAIGIEGNHRVRRKNLEGKLAKEKPFLVFDDGDFLFSSLSRLGWWQERILDQNVPHAIILHPTWFFTARALRLDEDHAVSRLFARHYEQVPLPNEFPDDDRMMIMRHHFPTFTQEWQLMIAERLGKDCFFQKTGRLAALLNYYWETRRSISVNDVECALAEILSANLGSNS
jgi:hypothetical protein